MDLDAGAQPDQGYRAGGMSASVSQLADCVVDTLQPATQQKCVPIDQIETEAIANSTDNKKASEHNISSNNCVIQHIK